MAPCRKPSGPLSPRDAPRRKRRRAPPSFWTRRQAEVVSSDIESASPARPPRATQIDLTGAPPGCSPAAAWPVDSRFREVAGAVNDTVVPRLQAPGGVPTLWVASRALPQLLGRYCPKEKRGTMPEPLASSPLPHPGPVACIDPFVACVAEVGMDASLSSRGSSASQVPCPPVSPVTACVVSLATDTDSLAYSSLA